MRCVPQALRAWRWAVAPIAISGMALIVGPALAQTSTPTPTSGTSGQTGTVSVSGNTVTSTGSNGCTLPNQAIFLQLANPNAGDLLPPGINLSGVAYDRSATTGPGIDQVQVFLDSRESGGLPMGTVRMGQPTGLAASGPLAQAGFTDLISFPDNAAGAHNLVVYARSAATQQEAVLTVPVTLQGKNSPGNETATPTSVTAPVTTCVSPAFAVPTPTPVPAARPGGVAGEPVAADGQTFSMQSAQTQQIFRSVWGSSAAQEWVTEHNRQLGR